MKKEITTLDLQGLDSTLDLQDRNNKRYFWEVTRLFYRTLRHPINEIGCVN